MQTNFSALQLNDPATAASEKVLRKCVHCGFCTATCPTFTLLGDELDSPRGRIYLIKDMLEGGKPATAETVKHVDRCLSCLSCMTTCPSGVNYMHLVDHARSYIEQTYKRPLGDRALRSLLAFLLPSPARFRLALRGAALAQPFKGLMPKKLKGMLKMAPAQLPPASPVDKPQVFPAEGQRRARVALLTGCAQQVVAPGINEATVRLLTRLGVEVVVAKGSGCCGALTHHLGKEANAHRHAKAAIDAWSRELDGQGLDAIVINASGCGTTVKDYGFMFREDRVYGPKAQRIADLAQDITEFLATLGPLPKARAVDLKVTYHSACSMQHGQRITALPKQLLTAAGFKVREPAEGHLCCGSAGTYNLLQPEIATQLRDRKVLNLERTDPDVIATGNVGCMTQITSGTRIPVLHTVELLDWATGGPEPANLRHAAASTL